MQKGTFWKAKGNILIYKDIRIILVFLFYSWCTLCLPFHEKRLFLHIYLKKRAIDDMNFTGIIIALLSIFTIGIFHPVVIKTEYYTGTKYWWVFVVAGITCLAAALFIENTIVSSVLGIAGASFLWSVHELFEQRNRVKKGWFPMNPKRKDEYK